MCVYVYRTNYENNMQNQSHDHDSRRLKPSHIEATTICQTEVNPLCNTPAVRHNLNCGSQRNCANAIAVAYSSNV